MRVWLLFLFFFLALFCEGRKAGELMGKACMHIDRDVETESGLSCLSI